MKYQIRTLEDKMLKKFVSTAGYWTMIFIWKFQQLFILSYVQSSQFQFFTKEYVCLKNLLNLSKMQNEDLPHEQELWGRVTKVSLLTNVKDIDGNSPSLISIQIWFSLVLFKFFLIQIKIMFKGQIFIIKKKTFTVFQLVIHEMKCINLKIKLLLHC